MYTCSSVSDPDTASAFAWEGASRDAMAARKALHRHEVRVCAEGGAWIVRTGAPESSNCPPGSSVIAPSSWVSAMTRPSSSTPVQPKRCSPFRSAPMPSGPS